MSDVKQNLDAVKAEAKDMIKTIAAIKGERYAETVRVLLIAKQLADIGGLLCDEVGRTNPDMAKACAKAMSGSLSTIAMTQKIVADASNEEWAQMMSDTMKMMENVSSLMHQAVSAGLAGESFGGDA